jgi:hypothetical protein
MNAPRKEPSGTVVQSDPWMSLKEAAKALGMARQTVLTLALKGEVEAQHIAGRTVVTRESVERLLATR